MSASLCPAPISSSNTSGLTTASQTARQGSAPSVRASRGTKIANRITATSSIARSSSTPAISFDPTTAAIRLDSHRNAGPYGAVVCRQNGETASITCDWWIAASASGAWP